jgi:hypothetical protein
VIPASPGAPGAYAIRLGLEEAGRPPAPPLFLNDPQYTVSADGADVGAFTRQIQGPPTFEWTNRAELATIDRSKGATFQWRGVPPDARLFVIAAGANSLGGAGGIFHCAAKAASGHFTIPAEMLANLPSTEPTAGQPVNMVLVMAMRMATDTTKGLDRLWILSIYATGRSVRYR